MDELRKPYEGPEPYIFVSYARKDADTVFPLLDALCAAGYRIWYDAGIHWTDEWPDEIAEHIAQSAAVLAFHSVVSTKSRHCKAEIHYAQKKDRPLLSVYLEDGVTLPPGLEMYLTLLQSVKLSAYRDAAAFVARMGEEPVFGSCKGASMRKTSRPHTFASQRSVHSHINHSPADALPWNFDRSIQWYLNKNGVLTIMKRADISCATVSIPYYDYDSDDKRSTAPWIPYQKKIRSVVITNDIDAIGNYAFYDCHRLSAVIIPDSVIDIGCFAFQHCYILNRVEIPAKAKVDEFAFGYGTKVIRRGE